MIEFLKIFIIYCLRLVLRLFCLMPVNERKVIFVSWEGRQYTCNPKYIFEYMYNFYAEKYIYIWSLKNKDKLPDKFTNVQICGYLTPKYMYSLMTAKYIITNLAIEPFLPLRKNQSVVYTWHGGGAYKRVDDIEVYRKRNRSRLIMRDLRSKMITHVISSCKKFSEIHSDIWNISKDVILPIGMPRNDVLFSHDDNIRDKICNHYNISNDKKMILYAPTYRGDHRTAPKAECFHKLDITNVLECLKNKFGKDFLFFYRTHYRIRDCHENTLNIISASDYPDMQELLYTTDVLITDYSSSIWDFSMSYKPCFIYAPDLAKYQNEQGFYVPIEEWPFPLARTNEQLAKNILHFDEDTYKKAVKKHHVDLGSYEKGTACEQLLKMLLSSSK